MDDPRNTPELTKAFTVVFHGDIRSFTSNPFDTETPFGKPEAVGMGNAFDECDRLKAIVEDAIETLEAMDLHTDNPLYERLRAGLEN